MAYEMKQAARQRKLESIRVRIAAGSYRIDASSLADAVLRTLVEEGAAAEQDLAA